MRKSILLFVPLLICANVMAQGVSNGGEPLSFDDALQMTMSNNPQITASEYEREAARHERKAAAGLRFPQIGVTGTYVHMGKDIGIDLNGARDAAGGIIGAMPGLAPLPPQLTGLLQSDWEMTIQEKNFGLVGGSITMPLYMGGKINAANRAAKIGEKQSHQKEIQTKGALLSELVERYYGLSLANHAVAVRKQVVKAVKAHLDDAISMEKNGVIAHSERLYMDVKMSEAERDLMIAQSDAKTMTSALGNTLNTSQDYTPTSYMFILRKVQPLEYFVDMALANNPQLQQVGLQGQLAQQSVKAKRAEFLPQVALMGGGSFYNYNTSKAIPRWVVGAGVSINIFDGLHKEHKYSAAKSVVRQVEQVKLQAESNITVAVEKLYNEMCSYGDRMPSIERSLEFATEYLRIKQAAFREGMASSVDVIDAELNLAKTRMERLQTAYYYDVMLARLLETAGASEYFQEYTSSTMVSPVRFE